MKQKRIFTLVFILILVFSVVGPAMADEGDPPVDCDDPLNSELEECLNPPEEPDLEEGTEGFEHPLLALFSAYYVDKTTIDCDLEENSELEECLNPPVDCDLEENSELEECQDPYEGLDCADVDAEDPACEGYEPELDCEGVDADDPACEVEPEFGEVIGELHDDGIGFGVLAKLMMISFDSQECVEDPDTEELECNPVTFEDLLSYYQDDLSMGQIFEDYGKPDIPGVGGLKNADKLEDKCPEDGSGPPGLCKDKDEEKCPEDGSGPPGLCKDTNEEKCPEDGSGPPGLCKEKDEELP